MRDTKRHKKVFDSGRIPSLPYKWPMTKKGGLPWYEYVYDEYYDCVLCPQYKVLEYATVNREGYREYKNKSYICKDCPVRNQCTANKKYEKTVTRHIWQDYIERAEDIRHSPRGKETYALRSQAIERVFADAKEKHATSKCTNDFCYTSGLPCLLRASGHSSSRTNGISYLVLYSS